MKKKIVLLVLIIGIFFLNSCQKERIIYYKYNDVTITRIDDGNKVYFYYGKLDKSSSKKAKSYIKAKYSSGLGSGIYTSLKFEKDKRANLDCGLGYFKEYGSNDSLYLDCYNLKTGVTYMHWEDSIQTSYYANSVFISSDLEDEKLWNEKLETQVERIYPTDD